MPNVPPDTRFIPRQDWPSLTLALSRLDRAVAQMPLALRQHVRCLERLYEAHYEDINTVLVQATRQVNAAADQLEAYLAMLQRDLSRR
jgi:Na+/phosphate symporter